MVLMQAWLWSLLIATGIVAGPLAIGAWLRRRADRAMRCPACGAHYSGSSDDVVQFEHTDNHSPGPICVCEVKFLRCANCKRWAQYDGTRLTLIDGDPESRAREMGM
jgi:hypothetical protein